MTRVLLTRDYCRSVEAPAKGNVLHRCLSTKGLALRVTANGHRSFVYSYTNMEGRERRLTIGELGSWNLAAARKRVAELRRQVDTGSDPLQDRAQLRSAPTMRAMWHWYEESAFQKLRPASQRDVRSAWNSNIEPILGSYTKVESLRRSDIQRMVDKLTAQCGPTTANRCHSYLRRILNLAVADGMIAFNVASANIQRNAEYGRERYLNTDEISRLAMVLGSRVHEPACSAILLLLLTGARKSEVLSMRWSDIDLETGVWTKPAAATKQGKSHRVPLSGRAVDLLHDMARCSDCDYVFPGTGATGHLVEIRKAWISVCNEAHIVGCRVHDLRHSFASMLVSQGNSLEMIGAMLGHSQVQTTKRYAHLFDAPLRQAAELVSDTVFGQCN